MKIEKKDLGKSQFELVVELSTEELQSFIEQGVKQVSREIKIDGFRPGKVPYDILKQKIGDMTIMEEAAHIAVHKTLDDILKQNIVQPIVGQPKIEITKLAPGNPLEFKIVAAVFPDVTLGEYKNLKIKARSVEVPEAEVEKIIGDLREMRAKEVLVAREIGNEDKVLLDIEMFVDQVPVEGGQGKNTAIIIGKDYVIPGFDKKIIGAKKDEVREFGLPYPANFHLKNLAGKMVDFRVKINEVYARELPALDDEFASGFGLKKIAELQDNVKKSLTEQKKREAEQVTEKEILEKIMERTKFGDIPALLIEDEGHNMLHELEHNIKEQGADFNDYLASIKKTKDQLMLDLLPEAVKRIKISLLIREIGQQEKIVTTATEIDEHIVEMKKHYHDKQEILEKVETPEYRHYVDNIFTTRKVIEKLREWNVEK